MIIKIYLDGIVALNYDVDMCNTFKSHGSITEGEKVNTLNSFV